MGKRGPALKGDSGYWDGKSKPTLYSYPRDLRHRRLLYQRDYARWWKMTHEHQDFSRRQMMSQTATFERDMSEVSSEFLIVKFRELEAAAKVWQEEELERWKNLCYSNRFPPQKNLLAERRDIIHGILTNVRGYTDDLKGKVRVVSKQEFQNMHADQLVRIFESGRAVFV